ncbi:hypothetical protein ACTVKF_22005 [Serratia marcescens]|jgi:hypothetical protein|uniref:hypothetical protein n=1 Tax=Serratia TaxID=613 RepID=UPI0007453A22|nr:hypothetical protein [Serratia marcescens]CVA91327.1 Uncharacterised protein [Serratia marcescens]CVB23000.1 Uncharacterised protein [Serratia marcescens]CVB86604.1 Uncharacterised protein [Serratia marcescens]CVC10396.1 Uncharacterised protein [Serratia marcescens]CVD02214.1 Uncharacterised protein [Serratia marcescens]
MQKTRYRRPRGGLAEPDRRRAGGHQHRFAGLCPPIHAPKTPQANAMVNRWGESAERLAQSEINPPGQGD